jgi:hypothetical protein
MSEFEGFPKATQRRFEFLEWRLFWERGLRRAGLESTFGISTPQASVDLRNYRELAPRNIDYDASEKIYVPGVQFKPQLLTLSADRLLLQLRAYLMGALGRQDLWFSEPPSLDGAPDLVRSVQPETLQRILAAIRQRRKLDVEYRSLTNERRRTIAPHALAFDGHRWHVRALCCEKDDFRDFVITRIGAIDLGTRIDFDPAEDVEWARKVVLQLVPHPGLTPDQRAAIECDYGMIEGRRTVEMRIALSYYFIKRLNLDLERRLPKGSISPERLQIVLENLVDVEQAQAEAKHNSADQVRIRKALRALDAGT